MTFGETVRKYREGKSLLLRQVAAYLEVDTAFVSKMERGERNASRDQVVKLAEIFGTPSDALMTIWLADRISDTINNSKEGEEALKLVLKTYRKK
jgi:transcriptional regulator with XRE-family HTH domain